MSVTVSGRSEDAPRAADGDVETHWSSSTRQSGNEWFRLGFSRDVDVSEIVLRTDRRGHTDRPRNLTVEAEDRQGIRRVLFDDSLLPLMVPAIAHGGILAPTSIRLPANSSRALLLRQTGQAPKWYWSIHEIEIVERRVGGREE